MDWTEVDRGPIQANNKNISEKRKLKNKLDPIKSDHPLKRNDRWTLFLKNFPSERVLSCRQNF